MLPNRSASALHTTNSFGAFDIHVFREPDTAVEHVALVKGIDNGAADVLCRIASECITGMVLDAADCDCREQLRYSLSLISRQGSGILILLRQEGRGHGLTVKIKALANKNKGDDTFAAVERLGLPSDRRTYESAVAILKDLNVQSIKLITSNPGKAEALRKLGVVVSEIVPTPCFITPQNERHLAAKIEQGHRFSGDISIA